MQSLREARSSRSLLKQLPCTISYQRRTHTMGSLFSQKESESSAFPDLLAEYKQWKAMGEGGTSHSWAGFISCKTTEKTVAFEDTLSPDFYEKPDKYAKGWKQATQSQRDAAQKSFLKEPLPKRAGPRVRALPFVYPQRERLADVPHPPDVKEAWLSAFKKLGENPDTDWKTSMLERHGTALFITNAVPLTPLAGPTQREVCHIHGTDMSGHVTLSFADAKEVIAKGWGERHRLSGTDWIHLGYTMVYVPNTVEETQVLAKIFQAGVDFMKSG